MHRNTNYHPRKFCTFLLGLSIIFSGGPTFAADADIQALIKRMDRLEAENAALKAEVMELKQQIKTSPAGAQNFPAMPVQTNQQNITNKPPVGIELYGFVKADMMYNDSQAGELAMNAPKEGSSADNDEFLLNARDTRLGLNMTGPEILGGGTAKAKVEFDFWGTGDDHSNSPEPRLRQAFVQLVYDDWDVLAGQTWDFFSPLNPSTLTFPVLWRSGNLGDRHPQIRLTKHMSLMEGDLKMQAGIIETTDLDADTGKPDFAAYLAYTHDAMDRPLTFSLGGMFGQTDISTTNSDDVDVWAVTSGIVYPFTNWLSMKVELFKGAGLAPYRSSGTSSTAQVKLDANRAKAIRSQGGFAQLSLNPMDKLTVNLIYGIDDVTTVTTTGTSPHWDKNDSRIINIMYQLSNNVTLGLEYQHTNTKYYDQDGGDLNRWISSLKYAF